MCSPALLAVGVGGAQLAQGLGQRSAIKSMNEAKAKAAAQTQENAIKAAAAEARSLAEREAQLDTSAAQRTAQVRRQALFEQGTFRASAGGSVEGVSLRDLQQDFERQEILAGEAIRTQREFDQRAIDQQKEGVTARTQARLNAAQPQFTPVPSMLGMFLNIGTAAAGAYASAGGFTPTPVSGTPEP